MDTIRVISGTCEITTGAFEPSLNAPIFQGENGALRLEVTMTQGGTPYTIPVSAQARYYLNFDGRGYMTPQEDMAISGTKASAVISSAQTLLAGSPEIVILLLDESINLQVTCKIPVRVVETRADTVIYENPVPPGVTIYVGRSPYVGANGNWYQWDDAIKEFVDTGIRTQGPQGPQGIPGDPTSSTAENIYTNADRDQTIAEALDDKANTADLKPPAFAPFGLEAGQVAEGDKVIGRVASPVAGTVPTVGADGQLAGSSVSLTSLLRTGQAELPNLYINGSFNIFQRGNSISVGAGKYAADRWLMSGNTQFTATRHNMGLMMTAQNSRTYMGVRQLIEMTPSMASRLMGKELCIRYLLHATTACVSMAGNTINAGATGECKVYRTFTMDDYNNVVANGYYNSPSIGVYTLADGSALPVGFFAILTYAQITVGDPGGFVTPARYADDLLACQRYYQKRAVLAVPSPYGPATVWYYRAGSCLWTPMRAAPVVSATGLDITGVGSVPLSDFSCTMDANGNMLATIINRTAVPTNANALLLYGAAFDAEIY